MKTLLERARTNELNDREVYVLISLIHDVHGSQDYESIFPPEISLQQKREWLGELKDTDKPTLELLLARCRFLVTVDLQQQNK